MELIVISSPTAVANEGKIINTLFQAGLKCFHIRKPESDIQTVRQLLNEISPEYYVHISLHQFHEITPDYDIKKLHYTEASRIRLTEQKLRSKLDDSFILSTSIHDISILQKLVNFDYVFYGPVFNSISKQGYRATLATDFKLKKINTKPNVIALGGIELSNLHHIKKMGFDGAAVLGTLWNYPDKVLSNFNELKKIYP